MALRFRTHSPLLRPALALCACGLLWACSPPVAEPPLPPRIAALTAAADSGDASAQYDLAVAYYRGEEVPRDYVISAARWRQAAAQGNANAKSNVGFLMSRGLGIPRDEAAAVDVWLEAAAEGALEAQWHLGHAAATGKGRPRDLVEAYARERAAVLAAPKGDSIAEAIRATAEAELRTLDLRLNAEERARAEVLAVRYARSVRRFVPQASAADSAMR